MEDYNDSEMDAENTVQLTDKMKEHLTEAGKWTKFMAIVGFVILALLFCCIVAFAVSSAFLASAFPGMEQFGTAAPLMLVLFAFLFYGMLIFVPSWHMFRFGSNTIKSIPTMHVIGMERAFESLKSIFKFYGILLMVILSIYAILFLVLATTHVF